MNCRSEERSKSSSTLLVLLCLVFLYLVIFILPTNIHGDGKFHTLYAREIVETGDLLEHQPYEIMSIVDGEKVMMPVSYPLTTHVLIAFFYMLGGDNAVKFFSPVLGILTAAFMFLLLKPFGWKVAFASAILVMILNSQRLVMVPLMEQFLLFAMAASLYFYYLCLTRREKKYAILTGLLLGLTVAIKQQGLIFFVVILIHAVLVVIARRRRPERNATLGLLAMVVCICLLVAVCPLVDQVDRNGTLDPVPGDSVVPFFESKYPLDEEANEELKDIIEYRPDYGSPFDTVATYAFVPFLYRETQGFINESKSMVALWPLFALSLAVPVLLYFFGLRSLFRRSRLLFSVLFLLLLVEIANTYVTNTKPYQYHSVGLAILAISLVFGVLEVGRMRPSRRLWRLGARGVVYVGVTGMVIGYAVFGGWPLWLDSGGYNHNRVMAYQEMGDFVQSNTSEQAVFLTGGGSGTFFAYYADRETFWISEGGGAKVPLIFRTEDEEEALYWLAYYRVDYIVIDDRQSSHSGTSEYIPKHGLLDYVDNSPDHFMKIHGVSVGSERLRLYEVIY